MKINRAMEALYGGTDAASQEERFVTLRMFEQVASDSGKTTELQRYSRGRHGVDGFHEMPLI
jgi:hypothetical protein